MEMYDFQIAIAKPPNVPLFCSARIVPLCQKKKMSGHAARLLRAAPTK